MPPIWKQDGSGWQLLPSSGFPNEAALHGLVEQAPHILPLSGSPALTIVGREVALGGNSADLIAIEPSGRLAVIEIKLAQNAEARRAVVAQLLTYAAYLRGLSVSEVESILANHLAKRGFASLLGAVQQADQEGAIDPEHQPVQSSPSSKPVSATQGQYFTGVKEFEEHIDQCPEDQRDRLRRLIGWAKSLEHDGLVNLGTYRGKSGRLTLLPRLPIGNVGLITIWNDHGAYLSFWRSVFASRAPNSLPKIEALVAPIKVGQGTTIKDISDELLSALTEAYREAAKRDVSVATVESGPLNGNGTN